MRLIHLDHVTTRSARFAGNNFTLPLPIMILSCHAMSLWHSFCVYWYFQENIDKSNSVASPFRQEGQSQRTFLIFTFSSRFFLFFPSPIIFPIFGKYFAVKGGHSSPLTHRAVATPLDKSHIFFTLLKMNPACSVKFQEDQIFFFFFFFFFDFP